jgi:hypothetical protein
MSVSRITNLDARLGDVLPAASPGGALIGEGDAQYALMPLDDDVLDLLLERDPALAAHCNAIRNAMHAGQFQSHEAIKKLAGD